MVCAYGAVGRRSAQSMQNAGARCIVSEINPICALQATMEENRVATLDDVIKDVDIVITTTGNLTKAVTLALVYFAASDDFFQAVEQAVLLAQNALDSGDTNGQALVGLLHASGMTSPHVAVDNVKR